MQDARRAQLPAGTSGCRSAQEAAAGDGGGSGTGRPGAGRITAAGQQCRLQELPSPDSIRVSSSKSSKAGVDIALVDRQPIVEAVSANGEITYDHTRFASLSSRLPGTVWRVQKNVGDQVRAGEVLALVDAAEVGKAKSELMQALAQEELAKKSLDRLDHLSTQGIVAGRQAQTAQADYVQARARLLSAQQAILNLGLPLNVEALRGLSEADLLGHLRLLGIPETMSRDLPAYEATANLLPVRAPLDAVVVERQVVAGEVVDSSRVLFQLADTSHMWLTLHVPLEHAGELTLGQAVRFRLAGSREEVTGTLVWISTAADSQTRMVAARAELPNPQGRLRDETFGAGRIILREEQRGHRRAERGRALGGLLPHRLCPRQRLLPQPRTAPRSSTSARSGWVPRTRSTRK